MRGSTRVSRHDLVDRRVRRRAVFRAQQGPERPPRIPHAAHRALRHLLLPRGRAGDAPGRAHGGALVCPVLHAARRHVHPPAGDRSLCQPPGLLADECQRWRAGRRHRRIHRAHQVAHRHAVCRRPWRDGSRARPRDRPRVPDRHREALAPERVRSSRLVHRRDGRVSVARSVERIHDDVDARRGHSPSPADARATGRPAVFSVPLRSRALVVSRRALWRRDRREDPAIEGARRAAAPRGSDRPDPRRADARLARIDSRDDRRDRRRRAPARDHHVRRRRPRARGAGHQPRRPSADVRVRARSTVARSVHGRRGVRHRAAQSDQHRGRSALRQPAVHPVGGRVGSDGPPFRRGGAHRRRSRADDRRHRGRRAPAGDPLQGAGRDLQPELVSGWQADRLLGAEGAASRTCSSTPSPPEPSSRSPTMRLRICTRRGRRTGRRSRSRPIASRRRSRICDSGRLGSRCSTSRRRSFARSPPRPTRASKSVRSGRPTARRSTTSPIPTGSATSSASSSPRERSGRSRP